MNEVRIVEAGPEHLETALQITRLTNEEHATRLPEHFHGPANLETSYRLHFEKSGRAGKSRLFICLVDGIQAGHAFFLFLQEPHGKGHWDRRAYLCDISFAPDYRGLGLGRKLLTHAEEVLKEAGTTVVSATVWRGNQASEQMFDAAGYEPVNRYFHRRLAPAIEGSVPAGRNTWTALRPMLGAAVIGSLLGLTIVLSAGLAFSLIVHAFR